LINIQERKLYYEIKFHVRNQLLEKTEAIKHRQ